MQYLLTKEELDNLVPKEKLEKALKDIEKLNEKILEMTGIKCPGISYCDFCPLSDLNLGTCLKAQYFSK